MKLKNTFYGTSINVIVLCTCTFAGALTSPRNVFGYEITTHALITQRAYEASVLSPTNSRSIIKVLGFDRLDTLTPFAGRLPPAQLPIYVSRYYDNQAVANPVGNRAGPSLYWRVNQPQEDNVIDALAKRGYIPDSANGDEANEKLNGWLMRGAIREDDNAIRDPFFGFWFTLDDRDSDPFGEQLRALKHFYDPINDRAFDFLRCLNYPCIRSTVWALGRTSPELNGGVDDSTRQNHFTWQDARNNFWWALTETQDEGSPGRDAGDRLNESGSRAWRMATTVKSLGHVVHLLQDTAQPQHTRNDAHAPPYAAETAQGESAGDASFEAFTDARVLGSAGSFNAATNPLVYMDGSLPNQSQIKPIVLRGSTEYPIPRFSEPLHYFTTRFLPSEIADANIPIRRGLADYSNRGFFTAGTLPATNAYMYPKSPNLFPEQYQSVQVDSGLSLNGVRLNAYDYMTTVTDKLAPTYDTNSGIFSQYAGKIPLVRKAIMQRGFDLFTSTPTLEIGYTLHYKNLEAHADALIPRAIAYSAGLIDYFFRGRLEVTPPTERPFAVVNQSDTHTVDADGYPRKPNGDIFGFEKVRLQVRNITDLILESGTSQTFNQTVGNGTMVAVARYHRNACYKPDLSGERIQAYAPPPALGTITEPTCTSQLPVRTDYQEISVSAPRTVASVADLPGGTGTSATPIELLFDFSADPIPVNATDLFIQVVYRGQLGEEPDAIAVGNYDTREPTFLTFWNNTDYFNSSLGEWAIANPAYPKQTQTSFSFCAGPSGVNQKLAWSYFGTILGGNALASPSPNPATITIAAITGTKTSGSWVFRGVPDVAVVFPTPKPLLKSAFTRGAIKQANKERVSNAAVPNTPSQTCDTTTPTASEYWCNDPVRKRRGIVRGHVVQPIYQEVIGAPSAPDVDAFPLPTFAIIQPRTGGVLDYGSTTLNGCPSQTLSAAENEAAKNFQEIIEEFLELEEQEAALGIRR